MLTNDDVKKLKGAMKGVIHDETPGIVRKIVQDETPVIVEKALKPVKKDIRKIKKDITTIIDYFDRGQILPPMPPMTFATQ